MVLVLHMGACTHRCVLTCELSFCVNVHKLHVCTQVCVCVCALGGKCVYACMCS